jgi:TolB-like protein/Tfp pilus assembly protein PilF
MNNFFAELKRRNVYKVAVAYAVVAWLLIQIATQVFPFFEIPNWAVRLVVLLLVLGFPVALILSWVFEITPEGIKREAEIAPGSSIRKQTGRRIVGLTIVVAIIAAALLLFQLVGRDRRARRTDVATIESGRSPAAAASLPIPEKSIAVLPFENLSDDKSNAYFATGIQDELLTRLSRIGDLKVISRTSTEKYKTAPANLREVAQQLGVAAILEGSVQKAADQVRVSVQLINALTDSHLWAETYDRKLVDLFQVETEIAQKIAGALEAKLSGREKKDISSAGTHNPEAYDAYLHGLALSRSSTQSDIDKAVEYLQRAVELDRNFAEAWAQLSIVESFRYFVSRTNEAQKERARTAAETALRLRPDMVDTHGALGLFYYYCLKDFDKALSELQIAKERAPNNADTIFSIGLVKRRQGKLDEAIALLEEAAKLDPLNADIWTNLAGTYRGLRKIPEAREFFDRALSIAPNDLGIVAQKGETFLAEGNVDTALKILSPVKFAPTELGFGTTIEALAYQRRYKEAEEIVTAALKDKTLPPLFHSIGLVALARLRVGSGDHAAAQQLFTQAEAELKALQANGQSGLFLLDFLMDVEAYLGHREQVDQLAQETMDRVKNDLWESPHQEELIARARAVLGDFDRAFPMLEHVLSVPYVSALTKAKLQIDPQWDSIRNDPRFQKLVGKQ